MSASINGTVLLQAIGELDEALIAEAAEPMTPSPTDYLMELTPKQIIPKKKGLVLRRALIAAAAVLLLCGLAVGMFAILHREDPGVSSEKVPLCSTTDLEEFIEHWQTTHAEQGMDFLVVPVCKTGEFIFIRATENEYNYFYYFMPADTVSDLPSVPPSLYDVGIIITLSKSNGSYAGVLDQFGLTDRGGKAFHAHRDQSKIWYINYDGHDLSVRFFNPGALDDPEDFSTVTNLFDFLLYTEDSTPTLPNEESVTEPIPPSNETETAPVEVITGVPEHIQLSMPLGVECGFPDILYDVGECHYSVAHYSPGITVKALEILPDTYRVLYSDRRECDFRLVWMKTLRVPEGSTVPDYFYYMIPAELATDLTRFDSLLLLQLMQYSVEDRVIYNLDDRALERIPVVMLRHYYGGDLSHTAKGILPITDDVLDPSLWEEDGWIQQKDRVDPAQWHGMTLSELEAKYAPDNPNGGKAEALTVVTLSDIAGANKEEELALIRTFEHGAYGNFSTNRGNSCYDPYYFETNYHRFVNGYMTNETVSVLSNGSRSEACFTDEDIAALNTRELDNAIRRVQKWVEDGELAPIHIMPEVAGEPASYHIIGWYAKAPDGRVFACIRAFILVKNTMYEVADNELGFDTSQYEYMADDLYFLVDSYTGEPIPIDETDLLALISYDGESALYVDIRPYSNMGINGSFAVP